MRGTITRLRPEYRRFAWAFLLDLKTYAQMREAQEELADIRAYDAARPKIGAELARGDFTTRADYRPLR